MPYLIGTDEAGYGPNLGPLVISATVWRVPELEIDLYARLAEAVAPAARRGDDRLTLADSKALYKPGGDLRLLERGLLPALAVTRGSWPRDWHQIWEWLDADRDGHRHPLPWHVDYNRALPTCVASEELETLAEGLRRALARAEVQLCGVYSRAVFPAQFNALVARQGTKGAALSQTTLQLVADCLAGLPTRDEPVLIVCDKHGGRNRYLELLQTAFPDDWIEIRDEGRQQSVYRWGPPSGRIEARFRTKAEAHPPAALASMACKYLRELSMRAFNDYWQARVAGLRATAGYPLDARRFKQEIAAQQTLLGIADELVWRER